MNSRAKDFLKQLQLNQKVSDQIIQIWSDENSSVYQEPRSGFLRGIDFYHPDELIKIMTNDFKVFQNKFGEFPNILDPKFLGEKLVYSKYFRQFKVPQSGNKLKTPYFIPSELMTTFRTADVLWKSNTPSLPPAGFLEHGEYYFKSNTGSGRYLLLKFPLNYAQTELAKSKATEWLHSTYGLAIGEWWYNTFESAILIEEKINTHWSSVSINVFCVRGVVKAYLLHQKDPGDQKWLFNSDWTQINFRDEISEKMPSEYLPDDESKNKIVRYSLLIGKNISFARFDYLVSSDLELFLLEVTFSPNGGYSSLPMDLQYEIGEMWDHKSHDQVVE